MTAIEQFIHTAPAFVAVAFHDLQTGQQIFINADEPFHPASTFKVGVMIDVFHQASLGMFALDDEIEVINSFTSIADGSSFSVFEADDSETSLYQKIGRRETIREITRLMIARSSNLATNILIEKVGAARTNAYMQALGVEGVRILRGPEDNRAFALGMNNSATARGLMQMMLAIAEGRAVSPQACAEMTTILLGQEFNESIPARLPASVRVAHKTGWNDNLYHDFGIVLPENRKPFLLAIMTRGFKDETSAHDFMAGLSKRIYQQLL